MYVIKTRKIEKEDHDLYENEENDEDINKQLNPVESIHFSKKQIKKIPSQSNFHLMLNKSN